MLRKSARRRASFILVLSLLTVAVIAGTAAIGIASSDADTIDIQLEGEGGAFAYGDLSQTIANDGSTCRITDASLNGEVVEVSAGSYQWWHPRDAYVGVQDSTLGVNLKGSGNNHYCKKIDYLGGGRSESLTINLGAAPLGDRKVVSGIELQARVWSTTKVKIEFLDDEGHVLSTKYKIVSGSGGSVVGVSASIDGEALATGVRLSSKYGSFGVADGSHLRLETTKVASEITTLATPEVTVGEVISDTATVTSEVNPTGPVTFRLYSDAACENLVTTLSGELGEDGVASSGDYTTNLAGTYYWVASYGGDDNNLPSSGTCGDEGETTTVNPTESSIATFPVEVVTVGDEITNRATVSGFNPTGMVDFVLYFGSCDNEVAEFLDVALSGGSAISPAYTTLAAGTYLWSVEYEGDTNNIGATAPCVDDGEPGEGDGGESEAEKAQPTISTEATPNALAANGDLPGEPISDRATVAGGFDPSGDVEFTLYSDATCSTEVTTRTGTLDSEGIAESGGYVADVGTYYWIASYLGDDNNLPVSGECGDEGETSTVFATLFACGVRDTLGEVGDDVFATFIRPLDTVDCDEVDGDKYGTISATQDDGDDVIQLALGGDGNAKFVGELVFDTTGATSWPILQIDDDEDAVDDFRNMDWYTGAAPIFNYVGGELVDATFTCPVGQNWCILQAVIGPDSITWTIGGVGDPKWKF